MNLLKYFSIDEYRKFLKIWFAGIPSEISFWSKYIADNKNVIFKKRDFDFEEYVKSENTKFLDVGSGPSSCVGTETEKTNLQFIAVDPLAHIYKLIKREILEKTNIKLIYKRKRCSFCEW